MSDDKAVIPPAPGGGAADAAEIARAQWESAMAAFGKTTNAMAAGNPYMPGGVRFNMPFPAVRIFFLNSK
jgi:hypothetical protein